MRLIDVLQLEKSTVDRHENTMSYEPLAEDVLHIASFGGEPVIAEKSHCLAPISDSLRGAVTHSRSLGLLSINDVRHHGDSEQTRRLLRVELRVEFHQLSLLSLGPVAVGVRRRRVTSLDRPGCHCEPALMCGCPSVCATSTRGSHGA